MDYAGTKRNDIMFLEYAEIKNLMCEMFARRHCTIALAGTPSLPGRRVMKGHFFHRRAGRLRHVRLASSAGQLHAGLKNLVGHLRKIEVLCFPYRSIHMGIHSLMAGGIYTDSMPAGTRCCRIRSEPIQARCPLHAS